jgi:hypothetical protein
LSSSQAAAGDRINLEVLDDVIVDRLLVIPGGSRAFGSVAYTERKGLVGRGGKIGLSLDWLELQDGRQLGLRTTRDSPEIQRMGESMGDIVVAAPTAWIKAPFIVLRGKDVVIRKGVPVTAYVDGEMKFDRRSLLSDSVRNTQE